ncbi:MAG: glycerophosphodiester phosphodiesterase family protein [Propionibacteriaceae bacterium]|jgi:glycerophosphoryl diester phosphodiesterase|nr:glycerophosphodiester phosphodiesterase family protein [Propionibacteriaceae bacterium]
MGEILLEGLVFGKSQYEELNALINRRFAEVGLMVVSHRGLGVGSAAQNTALGVRGAMISGADMIELDIAASSDNVYYCFHDGTEPEYLGIETNLQQLSSADIENLRYIRVDRPGRPAKVERALPLLKEFKGQDVLFNIDRSWWRWPKFLKALDILEMPQQLLLKCPAWDHSALDQLSRHPLKYPFAPICSTVKEAEQVLEMDGLNVVGLELLTETPLHPWLQRETIDHLHDKGVFAIASAVTLNTGIPLFGGFDDERAIYEGPESSYGAIMDRGIDAIQTDWPWLVAAYRDERLASE